MPDIVKPYGTAPIGWKVRTFRITIDNPAGNPQRMMDKPITFHVERRPLDAGGNYVGEPRFEDDLQVMISKIALREFVTDDPLTPGVKIKLKGAQIGALIEQAFVDLYNESGR